MRLALVFPGQGSQAAGMGAALAAASRTARDVLDEVDEALGEKLSRLMAEGPIETLTLTENAQPALMAASIAVMRVLEKDGGFDFARHVACVAGHSLGEYSALCAAGALSLADTARLLRRRGQAMQRAVPVGEGGMSALLGASLEQAEEIAARAAGGEVLTVANDNAPGQVVISGAAAALERAAAVAKEVGVKRAMALPVSAPFHSPLMQPAADEMADALGAVTIRPPRAPVIANVSCAALEDPEAIRAALVAQVTGRVRWRETIEGLRGRGVERMAELGTGRVLVTMAKRIDPELATIAVETPDDVETFLKSL